MKQPFRCIQFGAKEWITAQRTSRAILAEKALTWAQPEREFAAHCRDIKKYFPCALCLPSCLHRAKRVWRQQPLLETGVKLKMPQPGGSEAKRKCGSIRSPKQHIEQWSFIVPPKTSLLHVSADPLQGLHSQGTLLLGCCNFLDLHICSFPTKT